MTAFTKKFFLALVILYCGWLLLVWLWTSSPYLLCFDDAFYYFEIARNSALGHGLTFDRINPTNGFHPLWLVTCIPVYLLGFDGLTAVRLLLSIQILLWLCVCWTIVQIYTTLVARCSPETQPARYMSREKEIFKTVCVLFAVIVGSPYFLKAFVNGLESAIYAVCYVMLLWQTIKVQGRFLSNTTQRRRIMVGILGAFCFLARTDAALLLMCLGYCCLIESFSLGGKSWARLAELLAPFTLIFLLFSLCNIFVFGSPMQVSGAIKQIPLTPGRTAGIAITVILSCILGWFLKNRMGKNNYPDAGTQVSPAGNPSKFPCLKNFISNTWWFAVFCCLIIVYYTLMQAFPRLWHFGPVLVYGFVIFLCAVTDILSTALRDDVSGKNVTASLPKVKWILLAAIVGCVAAMSVKAFDPRAVSMRIANQEAGQWISENLPHTTILGSWDAGVIAYFTAQRIINIDGVVNSIDYARAMKKGTAGNLLKKQGITYLVNHGILDNGEDSELKRLADDLFGEGTADSLRLEKTWPFTFRGSTNRFGPGIWPMAVFLYKIET